MHLRAIFGKVTAIALVALFTQGVAETQAAPPTEALVRLGNESIGSDANCGPDRNPATPALDCPPSRFVGESAEAVDVLLPRTVVIAAGGTVTFDVSGSPHRLGICPPQADGTAVRPEDVNPSNLVDANPTSAVTNHLADCASPIALSSPSIGVDVTRTFEEPGTYLVICTFPPHFAERAQYGWVIVQ